MSEEESLKRSHSKSSNFKLTLLSLLAALALTGFVAFAASITLTQSPLIYVGMAVSGVVFGLSLLLFSRFKR